MLRDFIDGTDWEEIFAFDNRLFLETIKNVD